MRIGISGKISVYTINFNISKKEKDMKHKIPDVSKIFIVLLFGIFFGQEDYSALDSIECLQYSGYCICKKNSYG